MNKRIAALLFVPALLASSAAVPSSSAESRDNNFTLESTIAFVSTRDNPTILPRINEAEIYLMRADGTNVRRLTENAVADGFPDLSPDGKKIVFDSNRNIAPGEPLNTTQMFVMDVDGSGLTPLIRGGSASWSPDGKDIVFHRSASGTGLPTSSSPGASTHDSAIFVMNVDDFLNGTGQPKNITNDLVARDDDPDWSPVSQKIVFTRHDINDTASIPFSAELYTINADGTGLTRLTNNHQEERSPDWSPDGQRIAYSCNTGGTPQDHEICVINADGTDEVQLTHNGVTELSPSWSPDGDKIAFQRQAVDGQGFDLWEMNPDGTDQTQLTNSPGAPTDLSPNWGKLRIQIHP